MSNESIYTFSGTNENSSVALTKERNPNVHGRFKKNVHKKNAITVHPIRYKINYTFITKFS